MRKRESQFWDKLKNRVQGRTDCEFVRIETPGTSGIPDLWYDSTFDGHTTAGWIELKAPVVSPKGVIDLSHFTHNQKVFLNRRAQDRSPAFLLTYLEKYNRTYLHAPPFGDTWIKGWINFANDAIKEWKGVPTAVDLLSVLSMEALCLR